MYGRQNTDMIYSNLPYLLPLPLVEYTVNTSTITASNQPGTNSNPKFKKLNRIRMMGDLFDSEASNDAFPQSPIKTHSEQDTTSGDVPENLNLTEIEEKEKEDPAQSKITSQSLNALADMYDTFSSLDTLNVSNFICEGSCDRYGRLMRSASVCPGSTDHYRTCEEVDLQHQLAFSENKAAVELLTLKQTKNRLKSIMDQYDKLPRCDKFKARMSWPVEDPKHTCLSIDQCGVLAKR